VLGTLPLDVVRFGLITFAIWRSFYLLFSMSFEGRIYTPLI